jgi:hypothetical protein
MLFLQQRGHDVLQKTESYLKNERLPETPGKGAARSEF